jgi:hypothetical protein
VRRQEKVIFEDQCEAIGRSDDMLVDVQVYLQDQYMSFRTAIGEIDLVKLRSSESKHFPN